MQLTQTRKETQNNELLYTKSLLENYNVRGPVLHAQEISPTLVTSPRKTTDRFLQTRLERLHSLQIDNCLWQPVVYCHISENRTLENVRDTARCDIHKLPVVQVCCQACAVNPTGGRTERKQFSDWPWQYSEDTTVEHSQS